MSKVKKCLIICWFGNLPEYFPVWVKSCAYNDSFDFLLFTDAEVRIELPSNIKVIIFDMDLFKNRIERTLGVKPSLNKPYRICDFRPMYGQLFSKEISGYDYWGYCDIDVVFGKLDDFVCTEDDEKDAVFNGGHFTLIKNTNMMNNLFKMDGALFDYKTVSQKEAIYAFDETTGIQQIAKKQKINARFGIPYIETESKYTQLRSRMDAVNPEQQLFYWEKGKLYRAKSDDGEMYYQEIAYMHLQKRKLGILDIDALVSNSFWITPHGFISKNYFGCPCLEDFKKFNPDDGADVRAEEERMYKKNKIRAILKRNPFQIYVRLRQQFAGINAGDGSRKELSWIKY